MSFGNYSIEANLLLRVDDEQVEVLSQVCTQDFLITEIVNPTPINAILKSAVQQLQVEVFGLVVLKYHLVDDLQ